MFKGVSLNHSNKTNLTNYVNKPDPILPELPKTSRNRKVDKLNHSKFTHYEDDSNLTMLSVQDLHDWDEKNLKSENSYWKEQVILKSTKMINEASVSRTNLRARLTNRFLILKCKTQKNNELSLNSFENENDQFYPKTSRTKNNFNFNVFQTPSDRSKTRNTTTGQLDISEFNIDTSGIKEMMQFTTEKDISCKSGISFSKIENLPIFSEMNHIKIQEKINGTIDPFNLAGTLEYFINDEAKADVENMHKIEKLFSIELSKTEDKIKEKNLRLAELYSQIDLEMKEINKMKEAYIETQDAFSIINSRLFKGTQSFKESTKIISQISQAKNSLQINKTNLEKQEKKYQESRPLINNQIKEINAEIKSLKRLHSSLIKESILYYKSILKTGVDVRGIGLSWVIIKLVNLNAKIEYTDFPRFISVPFYNYLMKYTFKKLELSKIIELLSFTKKQNVNKNKVINSRGSIQATNNKIDETYCKYNFSQTMKICSQVLKQKDNMLSNTNTRPIEEEKFNNYISKLKECIYDIKKWESYMTDEMINTHLITQKKLYDIMTGGSINEKNAKIKFMLQLRKLIETKERQIKQIKEEEIDLFKIKYLNNKYKGGEEAKDYNTIYSALFGAYSIF